MYRIWGAGVIMHSDVYNKLHTEDPDEGWSSGDSREKDSDKDKEKSVLAATGAEGGEVECVNINNVRSSDVSGDEEGEGGEEEKLLACRSSGVNKRNHNSSSNIELGFHCSENQYSPSISSRSRSGSFRRTSKLNSGNDNSKESEKENTNSRNERGLGSVGRGIERGREKGGNFHQSTRLHSTAQAEDASAQMFGGNFKGRSESSNRESSGSGSGSGSGKQRRAIRSTGESYSRYYECSSESGTNTDISPNRCRVKDKDRDGGRDRDGDRRVYHRPRVPGHYNNENRTIDMSHRGARKRYTKSPSSKNSSRTSSPDSRRNSCKSSSKTRRASDRCNFSSIVNYHLNRTTPAVPVSTSPSVSTSTSLISLNDLTCPSTTHEVHGPKLLSLDFTSNVRTSHDDSCSDMTDRNDVKDRKKIIGSHNEWRGEAPNLDSSYRKASATEGRVRTGTGTGTGTRLDIEMGSSNFSPLEGAIHFKPPLSSELINGNGSRADTPHSPPIRQKISQPRNTY